MRQTGRQRRPNPTTTLPQHTPAQDPQMYSCTLDFRGCSRTFVSLLHTVACPSRCLLTCTMLRSGGADLFRTQLQVCVIEKHVFWVVATQEPQMDSCDLDFRGCSRSFISLLCTVACPSGCLLTCTMLRSGGAGLFRTQLQMLTVEKCVCFGWLRHRTHK